MSWFSEFIDDPIEYIQDEPLKALSLVGAPLALMAAPFVAPALGVGAAGAGLFGAGEAAAGAGLFGAGEAATGAGLFGGLGEGLAGLGTGAAEGLSSLASGAGDLFGGGAGSAVGDALGFNTAEGAVGGMGQFSNEIVDAGAQSFMNNPVAYGADAGVGPELSSYVPEFDNPVFGSEAAPESGMPGMPGSSYASTASAGGGDMSAMAMDPSGISGAGKGAGDASSGGFFSNLMDKAYADPFRTAGAGIAGIGLANNLLQGQRTSPEMKAMGANAAAMNKQSQMMMNYLQTGTLPPGLQSAITQATQAMKAKIIANRAKTTGITDPRYDSALAQELNGVDMFAYSELAKTGIQLLNSGVQMAGISSQLYAQLEALNRQQSKETGIAIANFAAALNGGGMMRRAA